MKRIPGQDPDLVLGVLQDCLRSVSKDIVREGRRITLFGLGPSPRAINPRDRTVIDVNAENGVTTIDADVNFQASAFLGNAPQDSVVKAKLDHIFEEMRTQLGFDRWLTSTHQETVVSVEPATAATPDLVHGEVPVAGAGLPNGSGEVFENESALPNAPMTSSQIKEEVSVKEEVSAETTPAESSEAKVADQTEALLDPESRSLESASEIARIPELPAADGKAHAPFSAMAEIELLVAGPAVRKAQEDVAMTELSSETGLERSHPSEEKQAKAAAEAVIKPTLRASTKPAPQATIERPEPRGIVARTLRAEPLSGIGATAPLSKSALRHDFGSEEDAKRSRWLKWSAWAAAIIVLVLAPAAWLYLPSHFEDNAPAAQVQPPPAALPQRAHAQPAAEPVPLKEPGSAEDPGLVIKDWELAARSRDAAAQAAFYADPVERYFLRRNLSRDQVVAEKQAAIDKRKGVWTVKMERVDLTRHGDTSTRVRLVKHFTVRENGETVSEWFVPSQLQLVRANGKWQITSERDLGWAPSMDELDY
jgi:ketosteroid isomerase-like protein